MMKPPSPPAAVNEYLAQLADYYRQLIEYHQQAAIIASQQLGHVQALLSDQSSLPESVEAQSWLLNDANPVPDETIADNREDEDREDEDTKDEEMEDEDTEDEDEFFVIPSPKIRELLEVERGKMLQIDYILRHFYGLISEEEQQQVKPLMEQQLIKGAKQEQWAKVPDAPNCWTLNLADFPDLVEKKLKKGEVPDDALPTAKVAKLLSVTINFILNLRTRYLEQLIEGVDYFKNPQKHYFWSETGIEKLQELKQISLTIAKGNRSNLKSSAIPMLPEYRGLSKQQAIQKLLQSNQGKEWTINEVTQALYGELNQTQFMVVREDTIKQLSSGKLQGLWKKEPNKIGVYMAN
ncbi:hypothetical protein [Crocosphaera sp. XPORK-15E]|uniref:hypothetical protein n=1 Tax=Crocosphaera sp. XPORK-15E TaxID=3110247 RepID=UPI002B213627|nr:hypothetical protein [Crocosphaera sp. XPORK-15E]MEA5533156.1 hypothetical protein [Crocosphaera sp. XPORK-15E]